MTKRITSLEALPETPDGSSLDAYSDIALLNRVAAQDESAFDGLFRRYYRPVYSFLLKIVQRPELVEELVNDTLLTVWQTAAKFEKRSRVSTWIMGIAYHKAIKRLSQLRQPEEALDVDLPQLIDFDSVEQDVLVHDVRARLRCLIMSVSIAKCGNYCRGMSTTPSTLMGVSKLRLT